MSTNNLSSILKKHGINIRVKKCCGINGQLLIELDKQIDDNQKKIIEDCFWMYKKVRVI